MQVLGATVVDDPGTTESQAEPADFENWIEPSRDDVQLYHLRHGRLLIFIGVCWAGLACWELLQVWQLPQPLLWPTALFRLANAGLWFALAICAIRQSTSSVALGAGYAMLFTVVYLVQIFRGAAPATLTLLLTALFSIGPIFAILWERRRMNL